MIRQLRSLLADFQAIGDPFAVDWHHDLDQPAIEEEEQHRG